VKLIPPFHHEVKNGIGTPLFFGVMFNWAQENIYLYRRMASSGMLRRVAFVRNDVSEELSVSIIRVTRIGELGTEP
jgi:hypothetical protein